MSPKPFCIVLTFCNLLSPESHRRHSASFCLSATFLLNISSPRPSLHFIVPSLRGCFVHKLLLTQVQGCMGRLPLPLHASLVLTPTFCFETTCLHTFIWVWLSWFILHSSCLFNLSFPPSLLLYSPHVPSQFLSFSSKPALCCYTKAALLLSGNN